MPTLGIMVSEGMACCLLPIYGAALILHPSFAMVVASKNSKLLALRAYSDEAGH